MTLLTGVETSERHRLGDAVRSIAWSPTEKAIALGAHGRALFIGQSRLTAPIGPDPIGCAWITTERMAVVDGLLGVVLAGGGSVDTIAVDGIVDVIGPMPTVGNEVPHERCCIALGAAGVTVVRANPPRAQQAVTIPTGPVRTGVHLGGSIWLAGGAAGLVVIDVALGCVDQRIDLPGVVALAAAPSVGRVVASDSTGAIHVLDVAELEHGTMVTGYPDPVRHLGLSQDGATVIAGADDELTWWGVDETGRVDDEPSSSVAHDAPISACAIGATGFVATGDHDGVVRLWSPRLRDLPVAAVHVDGEVTALLWGPWGDHLAIGTITGEVVVATLAVGELV